MDWSCDASRDDKPDAEHGGHAADAGEVFAPPAASWAAARGRGVRVGVGWVAVRVERRIAELVAAPEEVFL